MRRNAALALLVLTVLLAGCSGSAQDTAAETDQSNNAGQDVVEVATDEEVAAADGEAGIPGDTAAEGVAQLPTAPPAPERGRIIKEGSVTVEVADGGFDDALNQVIAAARGLGGDVLSSSTTSDEDTGTRGSVTVRVPVDRYEDLLTDISGLGEVVERDISSQDVSAEFVDLESRLRHLQAQEAFYLGLLDDAQAISDAITVQQHLSGIQDQIEQVRGRLNFLDDRTSFSTLTIELVEPGAPIVADPVEGVDRPSLARYWQVARDAFVNVVGAGLVVVSFLVPLAVPTVLAYVVWRLVRQPARVAEGP